MATGETIARRLAVAGLGTLASLLLWAPAVLAAPPANDDFSAAQALSGLPASATGTISGSTLEAEEPDYGEPGQEPIDKSIWFTWQAPADGAVTIDTCETFSFGTRLAVFTGASLATLQRVHGYKTDYGPACSGHPSLSFNAIGGVHYAIALFGEPWVGGPVELNVSSTQPPANDDFADPRIANSKSTFIAEGTNAGATKEPGEPDHGGDPGGSSVWFTWIAPDSGVAQISTCGSDFDAVLAAYEGNRVDDLRSLGRSFPDLLCESAYELRFGVTAGQTYRFALDGSTHGGTQPPEVGEYLIRARVGLGDPQNDEFEDAWEIGHPTSEGEQKTDNVEATREAGEPLHAGKPGSASVWWGFSSQVSGPLSLDTCQADFDTVLAVYEGATLGSLRPVAANDNSTGPKCAGGKGSELSFELEAGKTYWVAVDGAGVAVGNFTLRWKQTYTLPPDTTPPNVRLIRVSYRRGHRVVEVKFYARERAHMRCMLDRRHSQSCGSPQIYDHLPPGRHRLVVTAVDRAGNRDPTPLVVHFKVAPPPRRGSR
jgi:hypothetical protein